MFLISFVGSSFPIIRIPLGFVLDYLLFSPHTLFSGKLFLSHSFKSGPYAKGINVKLWPKSSSWAEVLHVKPCQHGCHTACLAWSMVITEFNTWFHKPALTSCSPSHWIETSSTLLSKKGTWGLSVVLLSFLLALFLPQVSHLCHVSCIWPLFWFPTNTSLVQPT